MTALLSAYAAHWAGSRVARLGLSILVVLLTDAGHLSIWWLKLPLSFIGVARGTVISPNQTQTLANAPLDYVGSSGAIMQTGQRIGTAVGIAVISAAMFYALSATSWTTAMVVGFSLIPVVVVLALLVAFIDLGDRRRSS